jgi:hypothetical protein
MKVKYLEDTKTDELVKQLKQFWVDQAGPQHPELYQGEVNPSLSEQEPSKHHWHDKQPDAHYFAAAGQEAPRARPRPWAEFKAAMFELLHNRGFAAIVAALVWFLVIMIFAGQL